MKGGDTGEGMKRLKRLSSQGVHNRRTERHIFTVRGTRWNKIQPQSTAEEYSVSHKKNTIYRNRSERVGLNVLTWFQTKHHVSGTTNYK